MRHGQMESGELLMVLIVVIFLFVIGIVFFLRATSKNLEGLAESYDQVEGVKIAKRIASLPQVACDDRGKSQDDCVDRLKLQAFKRAMGSDDRVNAYAFNQFGPATIDLVTLTGPRAGSSETLYQYPPDGFDQVPFYYPVLVYDPLSAQYAFGYWNITQYVLKRSS